MAVHGADVTSARKCPIGSPQRLGSAFTVARRSCCASTAERSELPSMPIEAIVLSRLLTHCEVSFMKDTTALNCAVFKRRAPPGGVNTPRWCEHPRRCAIRCEYFFASEVHGSAVRLTASMKTALTTILTDTQSYVTAAKRDVSVARRLQVETTWLCFLH